MTRLCAGVLMFTFFSACSPSTKSESPAPMPSTIYVSPELPTCDPNGPETCQADVVHINSSVVVCRRSYGYGVSPPNYSIADIGKPGVQRLTAKQVSLVRLIKRYVRSNTIRFAFARTIPLIGSFVIFDAKYGSCPSPTVQYWILNDGYKPSNAYYSPRTGDVVPGPGDVAPSPGPWCKPHPAVQPCFLTNRREPQIAAQSIPNRMPHIVDCGIPDHPPCEPVVPVGRYGIACKTFDEPNRPVLPPSYKVTDIGKPGVILLPESMAALARRIQHFIHSSTLRFTIIGPPDDFVVFDASHGPCFGGAPGYLVLNDTSGITYYQPGEDPSSIHGIPGDITTPSPGPWCRPKTGVARCY